MSSRDRVAIVGGGILGMTLAHRLATARADVTLIEAGPSLGGLAGAWQLDGLTWDRFYHVILQSDVALRSLLAELGLERDLRWVRTKTGFYTDGHLHSMSNVIEFARFAPLGAWDKLRLAATILRTAHLRDWRRLEDVTVADWLVRLSGERTFAKIWRPLLRAKLGELYRDTSAAFIWAVIARMYAARRSGLKTEMFGYVPGGYARILGRFEEHLREQGVHIVCGCPVASVGRGAQRRIRITWQDGRADEFDRTVVTAPAAVAAAMCTDLEEPERACLRNVTYLGVICASVVLDRPLAGYYITNITDDGLPFTAVIEMTALVNRAEFGGRTLVYLPKYLPADDPAFALPDEQIETAFMAGLERMYPAFSRRSVRCLRIARARYVLPLPRLGYSRRMPPRVTSQPGLYLVNAAQIVNGTLNVNQTVELADAAAAALAAQAGADQFLGAPVA
jgi:protoporphyrinogen oxidase